MILEKPTGEWLVVEAENISPHQTNIHVRFLGAEKKVEVTLGLFPGWPVRFALPLTVAEGGQLFLARQRGMFKAMVAGAGLVPADIERVEVTGPDGGEGTVRFREVGYSDAAPDPLPFPPAPLVDGLHQWAARTWPGKAATADAVAAELAAELEGAAPDPLPGRSRFGGWTALRWESSGSFRTHHDGGRWWLVDPEGHAFWSTGVDCINPGVSFPADGMERLIDGGLPDPATHPQLWTKRNGMRLFDAGQHNAERILGPGWRARWEELTRRRLRACGFNTVGNWSDQAFAERSGVPRVRTLAGYPSTARTLFRDFPDVFDPEFAAGADRFAAQLDGLSGDPMVLGYFMANEPQWAFVERMDVAAHVLRQGPRTATHAALVDFLRGRHGDDIGRLNAAWGAALSGWSAFAAPADPGAWPGSAADRAAFTALLVERFVEVPARACRSVAPRLLNLGLRWAWIHSDYQFAGARELDVFSINAYQLRPDPALCTRAASATGLPLIIGEFHVGSLDRGLPCGGIRAVETLAESVSAYAHYLESAAAHPAVIGAHYFQWSDQHLLGRFDGENMQIGLVDITGRMYPEWRSAARAAHGRLYPIAAGTEGPATPEPREVRHGTLCW